MTTAFGRHIQVAVAEEASYGTAPSGDWHKVPIISSTLGASEGLLEDDRLGEGREDADPLADVVQGEGDLVLPVDLRNVGLWLKLLLGAPETAEDTGVYTHVYESGALTLPSQAIEIHHPGPGRYHLNSGVMARSLRLQWQRSGTTQMTLSCLSQQEEVSENASSGTPEAFPWQRFTQRRGLIELDSTALADVVSASLTLDNGPEPREDIRPDGLISGADPGRFMAGVDLTVRYRTAELYDAAAAGTPLALTLAYEIDADRRLSFHLPRVWLPKPRLEIQGPGGIQVTYQGQIAKQSDGGPAVTATLINDVDEY